MDTETNTLVAVLRSRMDQMSPEERLSLMQSLMEGYCPHCGYMLDNTDRCFCRSDD